jgi:hypothetical protein
MNETDQLRIEELKIGLQQRSEDVEFWLKEQYPHYLVGCSGEPTAEGFGIYVREQMGAIADPELKTRLQDAFICCGILEVLKEEVPRTVMSSAELLQRLGSEDDAADQPPLP